MIIHNVIYEEILEQEIEVQICDGEAYEFNGELLEEAGVYTQTFTSVEGCDSVVTPINQATS